ncbi:MAG: MATE family efflux transporter [Firmicutes bacterium]|nr:MATE family efflux transporter [Bacillota bacterium]
MSDDLRARRDERRRMMLEDPVAKIIPIMALPMIITMLIDSLYNIADTYFVSRLGMYATAAVGVNDSLLHFMRSIAMGFGVGASSYISRLMGAKREDDACVVGNTILATSMIFISLTAALAYVFMDPLVDLMGSTAASKQYSMDYASIILISAPFTAAEVSLSQMLRSEGSTKYSMAGMVSGCVLNVFLDPIFISVLGMEVRGAALATTISKVVSACILAVPFVRNKTMLVLKPSYIHPSRGLYAEVAKMGIPTFIRSSLMSVSSVVTNNIAGGFSDAALASVSVANKCTRLVGAAIMGFGQGYQPIVGYCWGAKRYGRVRESFRTCSLMGATASLILGGIMFIFAPRLISVFAASGAEEIIGIGTLMVRSQCVTMIPHTWVMIVNSLFQAIGKPVQATILGLSRQALALIPCVIVLSALFGVNGLAVAQASADIVSGIIAGTMVILFFRSIRSLNDAPTEYAS